MLPFSFIEIFFFFSLAITFVLILLIVYHFKQRITTMEHKSDTMFDIVQNLAKEVASLKTSGGNGMFMAPPPVFMHHPGMHPMEFHMMHTEDMGDESSSPYVEELDADADADEDTTDDESDYSSDYESDGDDESIVLMEEDMEICKIDEDCEAELETEPPHFEKIKVEDNIVEPRIERQESLVAEELPTPELEPEPEPEPLQVLGEDAVAPQDDYKKMSLSELKKVVAAKGLSPKDLNKLKRQDLLKILQDSP